MGRPRTIDHNEHVFVGQPLWRKICAHLVHPSAPTSSTRLPGHAARPRPPGHPAASDGRTDQSVSATCGTDQPVIPSPHPVRHAPLRWQGDGGRANVSAKGARRHVPTDSAREPRDGGRHVGTNWSHDDHQPIRGTQRIDVTTLAVTTLAVTTCDARNELTAASEVGGGDGGRARRHGPRRSWFGRCA